MACGRKHKPAVGIVFFTNDRGKTVVKLAEGCSDPTCKHYVMQGVCTNPERVFVDDCPPETYCDGYEAVEDTAIIRVCP